MLWQPAKSEVVVPLVFYTGASTNRLGPIAPTHAIFCAAGRATWGSHTPQGLSQIAYDTTIILSNRCDVATPTTTISSISVPSEAVVKTEHVQSWS